MTAVQIQDCGPILNAPPASDEVEVSVIGPGYGECVVVHLGDGEWLIVDSCYPQGASAPAAISYLNSLNVDIARSVVIVVATHWHDDHVRGISELFRSAERAQFYVTSAFNGNEFLALASRRDLASKFTSGVDELATVRELSDSRRRDGGPGLGFASAVSRLRHRPDAAVSGVWSLSPSDEERTRSIAHVAALLPSPQFPGVARIPSLQPNDASVVLLLETVAGGVLLGADLEHVASSRTRGWLAVVDHSGRPGEPAACFKIPHHGSVNADSHEVWDNLVTQEPLCIVTPFERGNVVLPRSTDRARIRQRAGRAYITTSQSRAVMKRDTATQRLIGDATRSYRPHRLLAGQVQARSTGQGWDVRLSETAAVL